MTADIINRLFFVSYEWYQILPPTLKMGFQSILQTFFYSSGNWSVAAKILLRWQDSSDGQKTPVTTVTPSSDGYDDVICHRYCDPP
jgi:hypothetical protein